MNIERDLEFARKCVMTSSADIVTKTRVDETLKAIARQSVKSEDVAEAIDLLMELQYDNYVFQNYTEQDVKNYGLISLAITALQAYQPTTRKDRTVEEVQKAIEFATSELNDAIRYQHNDKSICLDTIITALQQYQPWVSVEDEKPESGKHVLLCCEIKPLGKRYVCDGFYAQSKTITTICDGDNNYEYDEETDEYYLTEGYYEIIKNWDDYSSIVIDDFVTHWKPLPEIPRGE